MQQLTRQENREELKEFRRALRTGNTISVTSRYSEEEIVTLIKNHFHQDGNIPRIWIVISLFCSVVLIQVCLNIKIWPLVALPLLLFTIQLLWFKSRVIGDKHVQAAALGHLALATLKHPGAEHPNRRGIEAHHTNLVQAIEEYLIALKAA